ncbi:MAG: hypothetical protein AAF546_04955 [Verrucomicrobiota bacterium]
MKPNVSNRSEPQHISEIIRDLGIFDHKVEVLEMSPLERSENTQGGICSEEHSDDKTGRAANRTTAGENASS